MGAPIAVIEIHLHLEIAAPVKVTPGYCIRCIYLERRQHGIIKPIHSQTFIRIASDCRERT